MVALFHSALSVEQCKRTLRVLHPGLMAYIDIMTESALLEIAKQVLDATIIRHKRQEKVLRRTNFASKMKFEPHGTRNHLSALYAQRHIPITARALG